MITSSIVLYKNKPEDIENVLSCALNSCIDKIYVIDNSPSDCLKALVSSFDTDRVIYIYGQGNIGYGAAHNLAFSKIQDSLHSDYHIVLNADISFIPSTIESLCSFMNSNKDIGLVMPKVYYPNGDFQYLCKLLPSPSDIFLRQFSSKFIKDRNDERYTLKKADYSKIMDIPSLSGCFMFFRSESYKMVGGFDERFFMHFEDIDITRRIGDVARTVYFPDATIIHAHEAAHKRSKKMLMIGMQSAVKYFNKWGWIFDNDRYIRNKLALKYIYG